MIRHVLCVIHKITHACFIQAELGRLGQRMCDRKFNAPIIPKPDRDHDLIIGNLASLNWGIDDKVVVELYFIRIQRAYQRRTCRVLEYVLAALLSNTPKYANPILQA
jgi:hypothetical protein